LTDGLTCVVLTCSELEAVESRVSSRLFATECSRYITRLPG